MEVIKRKSGIKYREMIRVDGKAIKSPCFSRKTDAKAWKVRKLSEIEKLKAYGVDFQKGKTTFKEFSTDWLENIVYVRRARRTYDFYENHLRNHLIPLLGEVSLSKIKLNHGHQLAKFLKDKDHAPKGINHIVSTLKTVLNEALRQGYILKNPLLGLKDIPEGIQQERFFSKEEVSKFLTANKDDALYPFYFTALFTGMRRGELGGLKWDRVDFNNNLIHVTRSLDIYGLSDQTKSGKGRTIPIHPELKKLLMKLHEKRRSDFLFCKNDGSPLSINHIYRYFREAQKKAGIDDLMKFHGTRHSFASHYMMNGGSIFDLQKILGHSDIKMTMRYSHHSPDHLQKSVQFMGMFSEEKPKNVPELNHKLKLVR